MTSFPRRRPGLLVALAAAASGAAVAALAQEAAVPKAGDVRLPTDICELVPVCSNTGKLGLPDNTPTLVVPDWGVKRLKEMAEAGMPPAEMTGYAQGLSDAMVIDWCEMCSCCQIGNSGVTFSPDPAVAEAYFKDMTVLQGH